MGMVGTDVIIGAYARTSTNEIGHAYVYYNSDEWFSDQPILVNITMNQSGAWFGAYGCGVGDVNKDGYDDVLVGASKYKSMN